MSTMTRPSRSRILPRGARMGTALMRLRSARSLVIFGVPNLKHPEAGQEKQEDADGEVLEEGDLGSGEICGRRGGYAGRPAGVLL